MDEVGRVEPDDVDTKDFTSVLAVQHLGHALTFLLSKSLSGSKLRG
jgi:hypothetical protein